MFWQQLLICPVGRKTDECTDTYPRKKHTDGRENMDKKTLKCRKTENKNQINRESSGDVGS